MTQKAGDDPLFIYFFGLHFRVKFGWRFCRAKTLSKILDPPLVARVDPL